MTINGANTLRIRFSFLSGFCPTTGIQYAEERLEKEEFEYVGIFVPFPSFKVTRTLDHAVCPGPRPEFSDT